MAKKITLIDMVAKGIEYLVPNKTIVTVGRNSDSDVIIPDRSYRNSLTDPVEKIEFDNASRTISREHCTIHQEPDKEPYISDGMSTNGTTVNSLTLSEDMNANLQNGYKLKLGNYELMVKIE